MNLYSDAKKIINILQPGLCEDDPLATVRLPQRKLSSQSSNHLASTDNLTSNNKEAEHLQTQANVKINVTLINNNIHTQKNLC